MSIRKWKLTFRKWRIAIWFLLKLGWPIFYNIRSPYARMRFEMMYGDPNPKITWKMIKELIDYGYWAADMKLEIERRNKL